MTPALELVDVRKVYRTGLEALKGLSLSVEAGDFYALLGPNGAGKSTTIGIITTLVTKTSGTVRVFGHDIDRAAREAKRCIGLVPQEFNFNIWEPVEEIVVNQGGFYGIPRKTCLHRTRELLEQLELWDKRREPARELSGGMKRRLMIARALIHQPQLLILDEPTAGVDIEVRRGMWSFLTELNHQGTTIILTTHYLEEAERLCRNIGIIDHGELIENTSMQALLAEINMETLIIDLEQPVEHLPMIEGAALRHRDTLSLEADVFTGRVNELFCGLQQAGIRVRSIRNKNNRLEELFMCLVSEDRKQRNAGSEAS
ncbi:MAG: ABC transporter ATP-binding protein [Gammaproteobacteria bacterium]|nr:MAG: ABC transporter ATP-binding protein [Gammaproteobacteria bacterium]